MKGLNMKKEKLKVSVSFVGSGEWIGDFEGERLSWFLDFNFGIEVDELLEMLNNNNDVVILIYKDDGTEVEIKRIYAENERSINNPFSNKDFVIGDEKVFSTARGLIKISWLDDANLFRYANFVHKFNRQFNYNEFYEVNYYKSEAMEETDHYMWGTRDEILDAINSDMHNNII